MHTSLLVILSVLATSDSDESLSPVYSPDAAFEAALSADAVPRIVRGQSPSVAGPLFAPDSQSVTTFYPQTYAPDPYPAPGGATAGVAPYSGSPAQYYPAPITSDPWLGGGGVSPAPYAAPYGMPQGLYTFGLNGPRPYKYGLTDRLNIAFLPSAGTSNPSVGDFEIFELDFEKEWIAPLTESWAFGIAPQFNYRAWEGPRGAVFPVDLPGSVYRFGLNLKVATPQYSGWSAEFGFNPAIATDLESGLTSDGVLFDGYGVAFWQWSPQWTWALGAAYWDRVDNIIVPYAGFVWTPDNYWEFRLVFPQPRISLLLGTPWGIPTWAYVGAEYDVEAYQINPTGAANHTRVQYRDWRAYGGLRFDSGWVVTYVEAGAALNRDVEFESAGTDFEVDDGFFARMGVRW